MGAQRATRVAKALVMLCLALGIGFGAGSLVARIAQQAGIGAPSQASSSTAVPEPTSEQQSPAASQAVPSPTNVAYSTWDPQLDANYYRVLGSAQVAAAPEPGTVSYGPLDALGRATGAVATVTRDSMEAGIARSRSDTSDIEPSGWGHNREVDIAMPNGTVYHGFLFNRSHLVAKSLGGVEQTSNLICGTRTQNVGANVDGTDGGMAFAEGLVRDWLFDHPDGWVYYAATPAYEGSELVPRSVIVDMRSSDGSLDQRIEVFNTARGFAINYATGTFEVTEDAHKAAEQIRSTLSADQQASTPTAPTAPVEATGSPTSETGERMVIVTRSGEAYHHDESCNGLAHAKSMEWVSVSEAEQMGRHPCGICGG